MPRLELAGAPVLNYQQIQELWIANGGNPAEAPVMAAIAMAESGGHSGVINDDAGTGDYSVGLWQINYYGSLRAGRSASYGTPEALQADPNGQAKAAIKISGNGKNKQPWTTYTHNVYKQFLGPAVAGAGAGSGGGGFGLHTITDAAGAAAGAVGDAASSAAGTAGDALNWVTGGAVGAVQSTGDAILAIGRFFGGVMNGELWRRIGLVLVGALVVGLGFVLVNRDAIGAAAGPAIKEAATAAVMA